MHNLCNNIFCTVNVNSICMEFLEEKPVEKFIKTNIN